MNPTDIQDHPTKPETHLSVSREWIVENAATKEKLRDANRKLTQELSKMEDWKNSNAEAYNDLLKKYEALKGTMATMRDQAVQVLMSTELTQDEITCLQNILRMSRQ